MKRKKFLALALAGVMTAATLTACAPLEDLYDWFFGSGSSKASHGSEKGLVKESGDLEKQLEKSLGLSGTTAANDNAKKMLEEVAGKFDATWLNPDNNELNDKAKDALESITNEQLTINHWLLVDVMELTPSGGTVFDTSGDRKVYIGEYVDVGSGSGSRHNYDLVSYSDLYNHIHHYSKDGAELYAGTFQKDGNKYAAMVTIMDWKWGW